MEEILKSKLLEYDKSTFLIDLIKHKSGAKYVSIQQTIEGDPQKQKIKINPTVLADLIKLLETYLFEIVPYNNALDKTFFSDDKQQELIERYLKGVSIEDLMLQFDCSKQIIEQILLNKEIEIVDNKLPEHLKGRTRNRKK